MEHNKQNTPENAAKMALLLHESGSTQTLNQRVTGFEPPKGVEKGFFHVVGVTVSKANARGAKPHGQRKRQVLARRVESYNGNSITCIFRKLD